MTKQDIYSKVTDGIIAAMERGVKAGAPLWSGENLAMPLRHNGQPYKGINVIALWVAARASGYASNIWLSYKQAQDLGGQVRKGEKSAHVVYAASISVEQDGDEKARNIPFMKGYSVFNADQIDGLPAQYYTKPVPVNSGMERIAHAERFVANTGARIDHGGNRACYIHGGALGRDYIQMPPFEAFRDAESYYAVILHELTHWTKHESRLNRDMGRKKWGDEGYAMEELVAELGAAFMCASIGLTPEPRDDHASYIASWLKVLKNDNRAIFAAASHAQKAADYLTAMQAELQAAA